MELNGGPLNGNIFGSTTTVLYLGFLDETVQISRLGIRTTLTGFEDDIAAPDLFYWDNTLPCTLRDLYAANCITEFDSVRDDGECNRDAIVRERCLAGELPSENC